MKALIISADGFEDTELLVPYYRLKEAGALYEDRDVVVDGNLVTSRQPSDLPAFLLQMMHQMEERTLAEATTASANAGTRI